MTLLLCYVAVAAGLILTWLSARTESLTVAIIGLLLAIPLAWMYVHETRCKIREAATRRDPDHDC